MHWTLLTLTLLALPATAAPPTSRPTMPYKTAHDAPLNADEKLVQETPTFTQYRVEFNGIEPHSRVPAFLYIPRNSDPGKPNKPSKHPAVLLQYGSGGNKNTNYIVILARQFAARGFAVLTIDVPFKGERKPKDKDPLRKLPFRSTNQFATFLQTLGDYSRATDYLVTRPDVDPDRLAYVGISWGAITGVTYAAHDPRIKVVASLVGGGNFLGWLPGDIDPAVQQHVQRFDPVHHVALIDPRPLLLLNVTKDILVPQFLSESLHKAAGPKAKKVWLDTDHIFSTVDRAALAGQVIDFVQEQLPPPAVK